MAYLRTNSRDKKLQQLEPTHTEKPSHHSYIVGICHVYSSSGYAQWSAHLGEPPSAWNRGLWLWTGQEALELGGWGLSLVPSADRQGGGAKHHHFLILSWTSAPVREESSMNWAAAALYPHTEREFQNGPIKQERSSFRSIHSYIY